MHLPFRVSSERKFCSPEFILYSHMQMGKWNFTPLKGLNETVLTLKVPITTAADDILNFFFFFNFSKKTSLDISCELSAWQTIHMKYQDLLFFFEKLKKKKK